NAAIARDLQQASEMLESATVASGTLMVIASSTAGGGGDTGAAAGGAGGGASAEAKPAVARTRDEAITDVANDILAKLPPDFDLEGVELRYPNDPRESMNTVLIQELARYNRLLGVVRSSLKDVQKASKGLIVMSAALEAVATDLFMGRVPGLWKGRS